MYWEVLEIFYSWGNLLVRGKYSLSVYNKFRAGKQ